MWRAVKEPARVLGGSASLPGLQAPELCYSMDVNALNYCRFSLLPLPEDACTGARRALVAVPNLVESAHVRTSLAGLGAIDVDVHIAANADPCWGVFRQTYGRSPENNACMRLSDKQARSRRHPPTVATCATLSVRPAPPFPTRHPWMTLTDADAEWVSSPSTPGIIMSMHLSRAPHPHAAGRSQLRLLCGYENGSVTMREHTSSAETSIEGQGWDVLWSVRLHVESGTFTSRWTCP